MKELGLTEADLLKLIEDQRRRDAPPPNAVNVGANGRSAGTKPVADPSTLESNADRTKGKLILPKDQRTVFAPVDIEDPKATWSWVIGARIGCHESKVRGGFSPLTRHYEWRDRVVEREKGGIWHDLNVRVPPGSDHVLVFVRLNRQPGGLEDDIGRKIRPPDTIGIYPADVMSEARLLTDALKEYFRLQKLPGLNNSPEARAIVYSLCQNSIPKNNKAGTIRLPQNPDWD